MRPTIVLKVALKPWGGREEKKFTCFKPFWENSQYIYVQAVSEEQFHFFSLQTICLILRVDPCKTLSKPLVGKCLARKLFPSLGRFSVECRNESTKQSNSNPSLIRLYLKHRKYQLNLPHSNILAEKKTESLFSLEVKINTTWYFIVKKKENIFFKRKLSRTQSHYSINEANRRHSSQFLKNVPFGRQRYRETTKMRKGIVKSLSSFFLQLRRFEKI